MRRREFLAAPLALAACASLPARAGADGWAAIEGADLVAGTSRRIAHHDSSWGVYKGNRQVTHPHPSFTPDERAVLFSADGEREPGLYLVDIPSPA